MIERGIGEGRIEEIVAKLKDRRGRKKEANRREWILHRDGTTINRCCVSDIAEDDDGPLDDRPKYSGVKEIRGGNGVRKVNTESCQYRTMVIEWWCEPAKNCFEYRVAKRHPAIQQNWK